MLAVHQGMSSKYRTSGKFGIFHISSQRFFKKYLLTLPPLFFFFIFIDWLEGFHSISHFFLRSFPKVLDTSNLANKTELSRAVPANFLLCKHRNTSHKILSFCLRNNSFCAHKVLFGHVHTVRNVVLK